MLMLVLVSFCGILKDMSSSRYGEGNDTLRDKPLTEIMPFLSEMYGRKIISFAVQEEPDFYEIDDFVSGDANPDETQDKKLRDMVEIAEILQKKGCTAHAIQSLMFGMNTQFDGEAPISIIRQGESSRVLSAAPGFLEGYR